MPSNVDDLERRLWDAADELRANSRLKASEYTNPVLGLIFLRYAEQIAGRADSQLAVPAQARFSHLLSLSRDDALGVAITAAMQAIEVANPALRGALPCHYRQIDDATLRVLLQSFAAIGPAPEGDAFGRIYEYFLGKFALSEGQKGGEFFTPPSIVTLLVEIIAPYHGRIYDPACGSGGMFVQSARFVKGCRGTGGAGIQIYGQERHAETIALCRMNLAVHGLSGDIRQGNTYYEDLHESIDRFDFVLANPPFNVDKVDKARLSGDRRYALGLPRADNANYLWVQLIASALNGAGRAGMVMANSASDARGSELEIRRQLIESGIVDVVIAVGPYFFYTVTLPCMLWFFDRGKGATLRREQVLFIDARLIFRQTERVRRDFSPAQIGVLANIVRVYRGESPEPVVCDGGDVPAWSGCFADGCYHDVPGVCKVATHAEIAAQHWSLTPARYVGSADRAEADGDFATLLVEFEREFTALTDEAHALEMQIAATLAGLRGAGR